MGAYIRELLFDLADDNLSIITRVDILAAIRHLYETGQLTRRHILVLDAYISGYTCTELEIDYPDVRELLLQTLKLLSHESGYTDELFMGMALNLYPKFKRIYPTLQHKLRTYSEEF